MNIFETPDIVLRFGDTADLLIVNAYLDVDDFGEVLDIEILDLLTRVPTLHLPDRSDVTVQMSCDVAADAVSIRLSPGNVFETKPCIAVLAIASDGELLALALRARDAD